MSIICSQHYNYLADCPTTTIFSEVDLSGCVMAERGPLAEVDTNVMAEGAPDKIPSSSLGKVALPYESLLSGKNAVTVEGNKLYSALGHAASNSFLPETLELKREDRDDHQEIDMEVDEHGLVDVEVDSDDDQFSGESWKENAEKPAIVRNLVVQKKEDTDRNFDSYPRTTLKVLRALGLGIGCGDPLIAANLLPG